MAVFALVDCNNFFVSCERVFDPSLDGKPVAILSNNDGCIIARSNEVKAMGIPMGAPFYKYKHICEQKDVKVFSSNFALYGDMSSRVMSSLAELAPDMEVYSVDEAFLRLDSISLHNPMEYAQEVREKIRMWTGIPVSIGIGPTKTLAKVANLLAKRKDGVFDISNDSIRKEVLETIEVGEIWGIGRQLKFALNLMGIQTAAELSKTNIRVIRKKFSVVGERLVRELLGEACYVFEKSQPRKNIVSSRSFGRAVTAFDDLAEALANYTSKACEKLRRQGSKAKSICISIRTNPFRKSDKQYKNSAIAIFPVPTCDTRYMIKSSRELLKSIFRPGLKYNKAGVLLMGLVDGNFVQPDFFASGASDSAMELMKVMDRINRRIGRNVLFIGAQGTKRDWRVKSNLCSPFYTTRWCDLPRAL